MELTVNFRWFSLPSIVFTFVTQQKVKKQPPNHKNKDVHKMTDQKIKLVRSQSLSALIKHASCKSAECNKVLAREKRLNHKLHQLEGRFSEIDQKVFYHREVYSKDCRICNWVFCPFLSEGITSKCIATNYYGFSNITNKKYLKTKEICCA